MRIFVAFALIFVAVPARAAIPVDGNRLLDFCERTITSVEDAGAHIACRNYVIGVVDGFRLSPGGFKLLVLPDGASGKQLDDIVVKYLKEHPERRHEPGAALILSALLDAFPPHVQAK